MTPLSTGRPRSAPRAAVVRLLLAADDAQAQAQLAPHAGQQGGPVGGVADGGGRHGQGLAGAAADGQGVKVGERVEGAVDGLGAQRVRLP